MKRSFVKPAKKNPKFWEIDVNGSSYTVTEGQTGLSSEATTKDFANEGKCLAAAVKLIEKTREKGYEIGTIVDVYALPYKEDAPDEANNIFRRAVVEGFEFTYIVVEAPITRDDYATYVGQYDIAVNKAVLQFFYPTRDPAIVHIACLCYARMVGVPLSEMVRFLPRRIVMSDRLQNFPTEISQRKIEELQVGGVETVQLVFARLIPRTEFG